MSALTPVLHLSPTGPGSMDPCLIPLHPIGWPYRHRLDWVVFCCCCWHCWLSGCTRIYEFGIWATGKILLLHSSLSFECMCIVLQHCSLCCSESSSLKNRVRSNSFKGVWTNGKKFWGCIWGKVLMTHFTLTSTSTMRLINSGVIWGQTRPKTKDIMVEGRGNPWCIVFIIL